MKLSNLLLPLLICVGVGAYAADKGDKKQQAKENLASARQQLKEAQQDYREALEALRNEQFPEMQLFGTRQAPDRFEWWRQHLEEGVYPWPQINELLIPHGDSGIYLFSNAHWQSHPRSQLQLTAINPELGRYFGTEQGVLVLSVSEENVYQLQPGDVILSINGREPRDPGRVYRLLRTYEPDETITLAIMRDQKKRTLTATVPGFTAFFGGGL